MTAPVENKMCPRGLEEQEIGSFRNLPWSCVPYTMTRRGGTAMHEEADWGWGIYKTPAFSPLSVVCMPFQVYISRTTGSQGRLSRCPSGVQSNLSILVGCVIANSNS